MSKVGYYLGCRLKREVPGFLCSAPNISKVASGRPRSRKHTEEVNIPEGIEKPCSLQEDDKPNVGVSKNRCLLSQMDYSLNCQLNTYKDRKDDEEDQKHRDSENQLLTSEAAYDRGCRLETEVPGFLCSAPNVSKVASGRPPSRKNTEVNVPEGTEESCSQQEEDTPNVGADKNRLLMSQVAYFLNYRRKIYEDRKDHGEEQKYRDSKNKLLMSKVGYYLGCRLKREVPGFLCSAPNISKVASGRPRSRKHTEEVNIPEGIEKPCSLQEDDKPNVGVSKNRCLLSQMDYSLNCQLNTYKDRKDDEEDQKHRDSENQLLTSEAAYDRGCRLETEVPGFLCSAPNVSKVASGRPPSRKNTEVNVPEGTEESCSQQEEDTPNVGADKNRLLMSQVAYFLNYQAEDIRPWLSVFCPKHQQGGIWQASFRKHTEEVNIPEGIEKPCSLQEDDKPNVGVSKNRCLMSQMDYSLNCQLNTYKDRKDDEEDQKHRDSENQLLTSEAAYDRGCRLETEVPGFLCSAPNVSKVASGRPPSRKNTEVNVPEGTEESCSQQEEDTPNVGADKNRLLMSQVAYFLNYRRKIYEDRKDHGEEQKYRDSKNKLLMSKVGYYLGCRLKREGHPWLSVFCPKHQQGGIWQASSRKHTEEVNIPEGIEKPCSLQEDDKPNVGVSKNRCLMSQMDYSLNCQLNTYKDRKDDEEDQKHRDSENQLLTSEAAYDRGCRLETEVPGFLCSAPNVSKVASGRPPSRKNTEVNVPEGTEESCSQQEEDTPNVGADKNRLLMSQVAYFLNYRRKIYEDRKDHGEEQKYRDSKNKLLMSKVGYYLGCRLKREVPGFLCSAPNISKVASGRPRSRKHTEEVNIPEGIEKPCSLQEDDKPNVGVSKNRCLMSQMDYSLNCQLNTYKDRKDDEEDQKHRDSENQLLTSEAAYDRGCRLETEVPGFLCSAPNVSKVASGRPPSRKNTEVNVPEGTEESCSQQEEDTPNVGADKNRLLMSQVAYFLNYQRKIYEDRKDHGEEQKYRDSKNKLLMSKVGYYLGCRLKREVPGFLCSAPNISKVASGRPRSRKHTEEVNIPEGIEKPCSLQEDDKPNVGVSKNRCLMSQMDYSLNCQLNTYKDRKDDEEDQKHRDSENQLLTSEAASRPGLPAGDGSKVASGRPPSRKNTEVNVPEGTEESCSQQEEDTPNVGADKNRLLMSQVAYFLNYRRKIYEDRKDHGEEQKYRDSKNKLLMSKVGYYLGCRLKREVPGFLCSAPNISKVASGRPRSRKHTEEVNIPEGIEKPCSLQEDDKPNVGVSKNRCLMSQMDYSLNCQLNTYKDRKDDEEDQKHRDSENQLLTSEAAYDRGCRLETEVPGFLCSAPNVSKVASGRPPSRKNTEVNVPEGTEESCSQQEEDTPNVGADKNRLLMSQVAYFLNYRRKIYEDRKDHGEEQKYRDSKNKLLMSKVGYYLGCRLKREVPGFLCSAPNISKVASGRPRSRKHTEEVNIPEGIEKPCSLQEDDKPNVGVSKNRCLMSQMDYSLNCQLNTYKDRKDDEEDQKHRDSENQLLTSEAASRPGLPAGDGSKVASGRPPSRKNTEVNVPEGTEESCSQQEEDTPNVGADKNRLLMSQVAYFLNYQAEDIRRLNLEDRKDHGEEQKYRDSKNKLLMSKVGYYLGCRLKREVPGFLCSAPNISKVASGRPRSRKHTEEVNIPEGIEKPCSLQEDDKPNVGVSKNRCLMSQMDYSLNCQLNTYKDRKDDEEDQKHRDSENQLLTSEAAYDRGCRLETEVPGFLCSAPNVSKVASGRPPSRKNTEVNVPEGTEESCSQQEEDTPNVGADKNRLLMSQVAYFLNYRRKIYEDRKDHGEEQKYRDSKNKLLMSKVGYYLGCRLKREVPGFLCSAPNISKVASGRPRSRKHTEEVNIPEGIEKPCSLQEDDKPNVGVSKNRCLMSQMDYSLNCQLNTYKDRKDDEEDQKHRDSENQLLTSEAAYDRGCRLETEVPGFLCSAPNVSKVASGRPPSRKNTEVNVPEGTEESCSQQEEDTPNVGADKNRLLMSQVAYFLNYRRKIYEDRKDHGEEQKYRDSKNKLLMSKVGYYLGCRLKREVPGFLCSAPNISKVASGRPRSRKHTEEVNIPEGIEKPCSLQEDDKPNVGVSKNRCLMSQMDYSLNCQLNTYKDRKDDEEDQKHRDSENKLLTSEAAYDRGCRLETEENDKDEDEDIHVAEAGIIQESRAPREVQKVEVKKVPEDSLEECVVTRSNSYGPTDSSQPHGDTNEITFEEDNVDSALVVESESSHDVVEDARIIHSEDQKDHAEDQKQRDSKNKLLTSQAAYYQGCRLETEENDKDEDEDVHVAEAGKIQESRVPREVQKVEVKKVPEDSLEECVVTRSNSYGPTDSSQPHGDTSEITFEEDNVDSALVVESESSHDVVEDARIIHSESQSDDEEEEEKGPMPPSEPYRSNLHSLEEQQVDLAVDIGNTEKDQEEEEDQGLLCPREVQKVEVKKVPEDSLEECKIKKIMRRTRNKRDSKNKLLTSQAAYYQGCRLETEVMALLTPASLTETPVKSHLREDNVDSALVVESESSHDVVEDARIIHSESQSDDEEEEEKGQCPQVMPWSCGLLIRNLQESVEEEAPQESWDEDYLTLSIPPGTSALNEPYRSNLHSLEEQQVDLAVDIGNTEKDQEEEEDQGPLCPRLSMELVGAEEPEVFQDSLDILYSTYTAYLEFYCTCEAYTYAIFLLVEEHVRLTLDVDSRFLTMTVIRLQLVSRIGVIFPH
ncbi:Neuroblastoma breakpoint family member 3 [Plecturocebus cupreus]